MIVIKPDVVQHSDSKGNRHPIYSIDFFGNRLATGGGGKFWVSLRMLS